MFWRGGDQSSLLRPCCLEPHAREAVERLAEAGVLDACPTTVFAFAGEISSDQAQPVFSPDAVVDNGTGDPATVWPQ